MGIIQREGPGIPGNLEVTVTVIADRRGNIGKADRVIIGVDIGNR